MIKRSGALREDSERVKRRRLDNEIILDRGKGSDPSPLSNRPSRSMAADERPKVLFQQFLRHGETYRDVFFLTRDGKAYATASELAKKDKELLNERLAEAGLPDTFQGTSPLFSSERPRLLIQMEDRSFVAAEALLPEARRTGRPLIEIYRKDRIFVQHTSKDNYTRYAPFTSCRILNPDEKKAGAYRLGNKIYVMEDQQAQLGLEVRPYAPRRPTTHEHARQILEELEEFTSVAAHVTEKSPLLVFGDDPIFTAAAEKTRMLPRGHIPVKLPEEKKIFVLKWPSDKLKPKPVYRELNKRQHAILGSLEYELRQHLGRLGLVPPQVRALSKEEKSYLGFDDKPNASWSTKFDDSALKNNRIVGDNAKRYYVCQSNLPALSRKVTGDKDRNFASRPEFLVETRPGVYQDVTIFKEMVQQRDRHPDLQRNHSKARVLIKVDDGTGYVTPEELKQMVGESEFADRMSKAKLPQIFHEETRTQRPAVLIDSGNGNTFFSADRMTSDGKEIPNYISFDRILARTEHGKYLNLTKALGLGERIDPEARNQIGLPAGLGQSALASEPIGIHRQAIVRSFAERDRSGSLSESR